MQVCVGWREDMWDVLAPLRALRPSSQGNPVDTAMLLQLRMLNFELNS